MKKKNPLNIHVQFLTSGLNLNFLYFKCAISPLFQFVVVGQTWCLGVFL